MNYPRIGVTMFQDHKRICVNKGYHHSIIQAGGLPILLPFVTDKESLRQLVESLDGLLLTGGVDVNPLYFGEEPHPHLGEVAAERDDLELKLIEEFVISRKPIFGICRGIQMINVAFGGTLYQDIPSQLQGTLLHSQKAPRPQPTQTVNIVSDSRLYQILKTTQIPVNSFHHQSVKTVAPGFLVTSNTEDGVVESIEHQDYPFLLGVQWHPEEMTEKDPYAQLLFRAFVDACRH